MDFDPKWGKGATAGASTPPDPRAGLVCETAETLYGPDWRLVMAADFAVAPDEIEDWMTGRDRVPDFMLVGLLRNVGVRNGALAAITMALRAEIAAAPHGDYSFPGGVLRNARVLIRDRPPTKMEFDELDDDTDVAMDDLDIESTKPVETPVRGTIEPREPSADDGPAPASSFMRRRIPFLIPSGSKGTDGGNGRNGHSVLPPARPRRTAMTMGKMDFAGAPMVLIDPSRRI